jgi:hypothetical protein
MDIFGGYYLVHHTVPSSPLIPPGKNSSDRIGSQKCSMGVFISRCSSKSEVCVHFER